MLEQNISSFKTNNVIDMRGMFYGCKSLQELDISNFNTNKVTNMSHMFNECSSLQELNLENFKINKVYDMTGVFKKCQNFPLLKIKCSEEFKKRIYDIGFRNVFKKEKNLFKINKDLSLLNINGKFKDNTYRNLDSITSYLLF